MSQMTPERCHGSRTITPVTAIDKKVRIAWNLDDKAGWQTLTCCRSQFAEVFVQVNKNRRCGMWKTNSTACTLKNNDSFTQAYLLFLSLFHLSMNMRTLYFQLYAQDKYTHSLSLNSMEHKQILYLGKNNNIAFLSSMHAHSCSTSGIQILAFFLSIMHTHTHALPQVYKSWHFFSPS